MPDETSNYIAMRTYSLMMLANILTCTATLAGTQPPSAQQQNPLLHGSLTLQWENDFFGGGTDRDYTNGLQLSWVSGDLKTNGKLPKGVSLITSLFPGRESEGDVYRARFLMGQSMFTPSNTSLVTPDPNDRPYAGWLYGGAGIGRYNDDTVDILQLNIGMVGPASQAEETQKLVHDLLATTDPMGWDSQLSNELAFVLSYQKRWLWNGKISENFDWDLSTGPGLVVGTVYDYINATGTLRFGYNLPDTLPIESIGAGRSLGEALRDEDSASGSFSIYGILGFDGRAIARNLFLDGNTFKSSPSVDKEYLVGEFHGGAGLSYNNFSLKYLITLRSREFKHQDAPQWFGNITASFEF
ncbi:lipid A deacylase LpxR family protein [Cerasicoccus frondis]|uniref:lipid A deacylase LpxR family protein n=1 Tax=Cerasicoccus frondis TaxID=490090 RepID=UPI002852B862|nr:lipid A deacylase LpxR family protein [Cerasicoccus frondis]